MNLFEYAAKALGRNNSEADRKLENPVPYKMSETMENAYKLLDIGERRQLNNINYASRVEKSISQEHYGTWEYYYKKDDCQHTVDWMVENDPEYFFAHIAKSRNRGRGMVKRMDDLTDYAIDKIYGKKGV
jgi:hypothetical protein